MKRILLLLCLIPILAACEQIDTGHRGVKVTWGEVNIKDGSLKEGLYFYNPITSSIIELDTRTQRWEGKTNTYTKDVQQSDITFVVNYNLDRDNAHLVYRDVGYRWDKVLVPQAIEGVLKQVIGQYDAVDLISNRQKATAVAQAAIAASLKDKGVIVTRFEMTNIGYLKDFEKSVEQKVIAVQKAVEEQNRTKQIEEQAKQKIISAQAEARSIQIRAQALSSNQKLVEWETVQMLKEKWNGQLPQIVMGNSSIPMIDLRNIKAGQ